MSLPSDCLRLISELYPGSGHWGTLREIANTGKGAEPARNRVNKEKQGRDGDSEVEREEWHQELLAARLRDEVRFYSTPDPLTGLYLSPWWDSDSGSD